MTAASASLALSRVRDRATGRWWVLFGLVAITGIAFRVWIYRSALGVPNSDEAVVGLMVMHAARGDVSTFFWGGGYGGPQEVLLTVPLFWIFGSSYLALRIVPIVLDAVACVLVWRVGRRTIGEPAAGVAAALFWIWPPFDLFQLTQHQSFFAANVVYCGLVLLLALRVAERPDRTRAAVFGFVLGFAFFQTPHIVPVAIPAVAWTIWKAPRALRHGWAAVAGVLVGASPWIVWNIAHDWASLGVHTSLDTYRDSLRSFASPILPMTLGLRAPFTGEVFVPTKPLFYLVYLALLVLFAYGAVKTRTRPISILYVVAALFPFVYAIDRRTSFITAWPQYTVVVTPVFALLVAQVARTYTRAVALLALVCVLELVTIPRMDAYYHEAQPIPRAPRNVMPLVSTLDRLGLDRVYADYWIAYLVDFASHERITAVENRLDGITFPNGRAIVPPDPDARYRPYERKVEAANPGFVFFRRTAPSVPAVKQLEQHGYSRHVVGPFVVYAPPVRAAG